MSKKDFDSNVSLITDQWNIVKEALYSGEVSYKETDKLINEYDFFNRFDNMFKIAVSNFETPLSDIHPIYRAVKGEQSLTNYGRMTPLLKYAKYYNRMNPPGELFIYLGILGEIEDEVDDVKKHITKTLTRELRLKESIATMCEFQITETGKNKKVINICGDIKLPKSEIEMHNYIIKQIIMKKATENLEQVVARNMANLYINMFNTSKIFKPIETDEEEIKKYEYAPFHALANYIMEQGYAGIIFRSTVHESGTNLVLFDPNDVYVVKDTMEHINSSDYL